MQQLARHNNFSAAHTRSQEHLRRHNWGLHCVLLAHCQALMTVSYGLIPFADSCERANAAKVSGGGGGNCDSSCANLAFGVLSSMFGESTDGKVA